MEAQQLKAVYSAIYERGAADEVTIVSASGLGPAVVTEALAILMNAGYVAETNVAEMRYRTRYPD